MNVLGGVLQPDAGEMLLAGQPYSPQTPLDAAGQGIAVVHQELNLFANLSIAENLFLTELPCRRRLGIPCVDRRAAAPACDRSARNRRPAAGS